MSIWKKMIPILTIPITYYLLQSKKPDSSHESLNLSDLFNFWKDKYQLMEQQNTRVDIDILYQQALQAKKETTTLDYYVQVHEALKKINMSQYQETALYAKYRDFTFIYEKDRISTLTILHQHELLHLTTFDTLFFEECLTDLKQFYPLQWRSKSKKSH